MYPPESVNGTIIGGTIGEGYWVGRLFNCKTGNPIGSVITADTEAELIKMAHCIVGAMKAEYLKQSGGEQEWNRLYEDGFELRIYE